MSDLSVWGDGGQLVTPDDVAQKRALAQALIGQSQQPANYWSQGVANMVNSFLGGFENGRADKAQAGIDDYNAKIVQGLFGNKNTQAAQAAAAPTIAQAPSSATPPDYGTSSASPVAHAIGQNMAVDSFTDRLANAESGGDPNAANPASSARGLYQITAPTQAGIARNHPEANLPATGNLTPQQQKIAALLLDQDNRTALSAQGVQPTDANAYGAWFLGAPTAAKVLTASDSTPVSALTGSAAIKANPFLQGMTVGDFRNWTAGKIGAPAPPTAQLAPAAVQPQSGVQGVQATPAMPQQSGPSQAQLMQVLADPRANQQTRGIAMNLLSQQQQAAEQQTAQAQWLQRQNYSNAQDQNNWRARQQYLTQQQESDPLRQAQIAEAQARAQTLMHPQQQPRAFQTITGDQAQVRNLDPSQTWQIGADGSVKSLGKSPETAAQTQKATQENAASAIDSIDAAANNALDLLKAHPSGTTGTLGHYAAELLPGSNAAQLRDYVNTIKSNGSYAALSALKAQGVSMGAMSDADMRLAETKAGAINPDAPPDVLRRQISDYTTTVKRLYQGSGGAGSGRTTTTGVKWSID